MPNFTQDSSFPHRIGLIAAMVSQLFLAGIALAGPPLVIDDPAILDPGAWEVIIAVAGEDRPAHKIAHAPSLDVSLGVSPNSQFSFFLPHSVVDSGQPDKESGLGLASLGYKWRVVSRPAWEWALAVNYEMLISHDLHRRNGPDDIRILSLPLLVAHTRGAWTWNGQLGWNKVSDGVSFWDYGLAVSHPLGDKLHVMAEVYGFADASFDEKELNYQLGVDYQVSPAFHLLASVGSRIKSGFEPASRLHYNYFIGLQWFSGSN